MLDGVVGEPAKHDLLLGACKLARPAGGSTHRKPVESQRTESSDPTGDGPAVDAEEVGNLLDRVSVEYALDGKNPSAFQFDSRARGSHPIQDNDYESRVALFS